MVDFARAAALAMAAAASGDMVEDDARLLREFSAGDAGGVVAGGPPLPDASLLLHVVELLARSAECGAVMVGDARVAPVLVHIVVHAARAAPLLPPVLQPAATAAAAAAPLVGDGRHAGHRRHATAAGAVADRACSALAHLAASHGQTTVRALVRAGQLHHLVRLIGGPVTRPAWKVRRRRLDAGAGKPPPPHSGVGVHSRGLLARFPCVCRRLPLFCRLNRAMRRCSSALLRCCARACAFFVPGSVGCSLLRASCAPRVGTC